MNREDIKKWTTEKLKQEGKGLHEQIYFAECYGVRDMILLGWIEEELFSRGYEFKESKKVTIGRI